MFSTYFISALAPLNYLSTFYVELLALPAYKGKFNVQRRFAHIKVNSTLNRGKLSKIFNSSNKYNIITNYFL